MMEVQGNPAHDPLVTESRRPIAPEHDAGVDDADIGLELESSTPKSQKSNGSPKSTRTSGDSQQRSGKFKRSTSNDIHPLVGKSRSGFFCCGHGLAAAGGGDKMSAGEELKLFIKGMSVCSQLFALNCLP
jgi:hypothetical protein